MIDRFLIRQKVVQVIYSYYQNGRGKISSAERELSRSVGSVHRLYDTLLFILVDVWRQSCRSVARKKKRGIRVSGKELRFSENRFLAQLDVNEELFRNIQPEEMGWIYDSGLLTTLYDKVLESEELENYSKEDADYELDKKLCRDLYRAIMTDNQELDDILEGQDIYWNGDKSLVDAYILKTIKTFKESNDAGQELQSGFKDDEDRQFSIDLLHAGLDAEGECKEFIDKYTKNWDPSRLAFMDALILQTALGEILYFKNIPLNVSINEYVEVAKYLSTPNSGGFVNGILDTVAKELLEQGRINK